jgi:hypothetical protein
LQFQTLDFGAVLELAPADVVEIQMRPLDVDEMSTGAWSALDVVQFADSVMCPPGNVLYVDAGAVGAGNGTSWADAFTELRNALAVLPYCPGVTEVWVAEGTYKPTLGSDRTGTFQLVNGVALYGGFSRTETMLGERDLATNVTILSGDIGVAADSTDNSYHVVTAGAGIDSTTVLDGFTVTEGNADSSAAVESGGGVCNPGDGSPTIANVIFSSNTAAGDGGGMYCGGSPRLINVIFHGNTAGMDGGAMINTGGVPTFTNVTLSANTAGGSGGGMRNESANPILVNAIFWGNSAASGPQIRNQSATPAISYSLIQGSGGSGAGWDTALGTDGGNNIDADPLFVDELGGDLHLIAVSPAFNTGNNSAPNISASDLEGKARISGGTVDMGAYEFDLGLVIQSITDVANDQGRHVRISFTASTLDVGGSPFPIVQYEAFRRHDPLPSHAVDLPSGSKLDGKNVKANNPRAQKSAMIPGWEFVGAIPAHGETEYLMIAPTLADSTIADGMHWSVFFLRAATAEPVVFFDSVVDSGYSLDNLVPSVPEGFAIAYNTGSGNQLTWEECPDEDFRYFQLYRSTDPDFVPSQVELVHSTIGTNWTDPDCDGWNVYYKITAVDFSGNESDPASAGTMTAVTEPVIPKTYALYPNVPNPFNPATVIRFDVPAGGGEVTLRVYDVSGRLVRKLVDGTEEAGEKTVTWNGRNNRGQMVASGVYFYRMTAPGFEMTKKMVLLQ